MDMLILKSATPLEEKKTNTAELPQTIKGKTVGKSIDDFKHITLKDFAKSGGYAIDVDGENVLWQGVDKVIELAEPIEQNTAEWIFPELVTGRYKCSHCRGNADRTTRFCPYCGYLMSNYMTEK